MKICMITQGYPPVKYGGGANYVRRISKYLKGQGHEVFIISTKLYAGKNSFSPTVDYFDDTKIYRFFPLNLYSLNYLEQPILKKFFWHILDIWNPHPYYVIQKILKEERPDIVHIHTYRGFSLSVFDAPSGIPTIFTLHDAGLLCLRATFCKPNGRPCVNPPALCKLLIALKRRILFGKPNVVISPSNFILSRLVDNGFFKNSRKMVIPLGALPVRTKHKKTKFFEILFAGGLTVAKGAFVLLKAFKKLKVERIRLHMAGVGCGVDAITQEFKDKRIVFHGFLLGSRLKELYKKANVTVVPSIYPDNSPTVIYESYSFGVPVIGSDIGGIPELIDAETGLLVKPNDVDDLVDKLNFLIKNPALCKRMGKNASAKLRKELNFNHLMNRLVAVYEDLCSSTASKKSRA